MTTPSAAPLAAREIWIDALKGFGVALVVFGHNPELVGYGALRGLIYSFHMPMFFALSGLTLCALRPAQWAQRTLSLLWIYAMLSLVFLPLALMHDGNFIPTPQPVLPNILAGIAYGVSSTIRIDTLWFLPVLALGCLLAWPIVSACETRIGDERRRGFVLFGLALLLVTLGSAGLHDIDRSPMTKQLAWAGAGTQRLWPWTANIVPFITGFILLGRALVRLPEARPAVAGVAIACLGLLWIGCFLRSGAGMLPWTLDLSHAQIGPDPAWTTLAALAGCTFWILLLRRSGQQLRFAAWIGRSSLAVMVLHPMIQHSLSRIGGGIGPWLGFTGGLLIPVVLDRALLNRHSLGQLFFYPRNFLRKHQHGFR
ncbi:acyltransferase family protein [Uliginosibacterium paludis]|uniref:Acyltransferase family protein n=1 Tax=Uliginosibacterium paludis TaxID=1615952 RepID=A0ABV2CNM3_9RHOO